MPTRRRNWLAIAVGTLVMQFSYFPYVSTFVGLEGGERSPDFAVVAAALAVAPLVFIAVGLVSQRTEWLRRTVISFALLVVVGLSLGLLDPALGAAAGFGVGFAITLNMPELVGQMRRRLLGVAGAVVYMFVMLLLINPAGLLAGAILPGLAVGFADEYGIWREATRRAG